MSGSLRETAVLSAPSLVPMEPENRAAYVRMRLDGSLWGRWAPAHAAYAACLKLGGWLAAAGVGADTLTYLSLALALGAGIAAALQAFAIAALLVVASGICDVLDGAVARASGSQSRYGALLDSTIDRYSDVLPLVGLIVAFKSAGFALVVPALALLGSFSVSYVRARAESLGAKLPALFMRRTERVLLLTLCLLLGTLPFGFRDGLMLGVLGLCAVLQAAGTIAALRAARSAFDKHPGPLPASRPPDAGADSH